MKLTFLGTRGYIDERNRRHRMHTSLMVSYYRARVMVDCGEDWLNRFESLRPGAVFITHAHPDHVSGLANGVPCPVYAPQHSWDNMTDFHIDNPRILGVRTPVEVHGITFEAFDVEHSVRAPAVGYRITAGTAVVFYVPDVVYIPDRREALKGVKIYIGDGATLTRSFVRKTGDRLIGHTPVRTQLTWCRKEGVQEAIITHCGSEIVTGDERRLKAVLENMAAERSVAVTIAHDGMVRIVR